MNIYVSHLSWGTKSDSLQNLFFTVRRGILG